MERVTLLEAHVEELTQENISRESALTGDRTAQHLQEQLEAYATEIESLRTQLDSLEGLRTTAEAKAVDAEGLFMELADARGEVETLRQALADGASSNSTLNSNAAELEEFR